MLLTIFLEQVNVLNLVYLVVVRYIQVQLFYPFSNTQINSGTFNSMISLDLTFIYTENTHKNKENSS